MNILEYIDDCMMQGMTEDDAMLCAAVYFNLDWDTGDEHELYEDEYEDNAW